MVVESTSKGEELIFDRREEAIGYYCSRREDKWKASHAGYLVAEICNCM